MTALRMSVRVARKRAEARDVCTLELVRPDGGPLPAFDAGAHVDVFLPGGVTRQYSLCNHPRENDRYLIAVLREPAGRGGSLTVHESVHEGDLLEISPPRNHFPLAHDASHSLLFAGGIGITPILCMAEDLASRGADFDLHYCTRSVERTAFQTRIRASAFASRVAFHFDDGGSEQRLDLTETLRGFAAGRHLYVCGPKGFMDAVVAAARAAGWPDSNLHLEYFAGAPVHAANDGAFDVRLARSGKVVRVAPEESVLGALERVGVTLPTSCEQGVCGTCLTSVLEGEPDHRDMYLTPDEQARNDQFLPCCSRARSPLLVLDL